MAARAPLTSAQQRLVEGALDLVPRVARRVARRYSSVAFEDLLSAGREALVDAARTYDGGRGVPFEAFAYLRVHGELRDQAARESLPIADRVRRSLDVGAEALAPPSEAADLDALEDTLDDARARATAWASEVAMSFTAAYLLGESPRNPERDVAAARDRAATGRALREAIDLLSEDDAALAREHYQDGVSLGTIAIRRGVAERTIQRHHRKILEALRRALTARGVTEGISDS